MTHLLRVALLALASSLPASASARPPAEPDEEIIEETTEIIEVEPSRGPTWMGLRVATVVTPFRAVGPVRPGKRVIGNQARACLDPLASRYCGSVRGFDLRIEMFEARDRSAYPRWLAYFRTGYTAGRFDFEPSDEGTGFAEGESTSLAYHTVPLFFGGNVYLFKRFPVRPYAGLGFGFDVLRLQYDRQGESDLVDASARIGFELHGGLEARITNYVSLAVEVMQLWSARRKLDGVPDYSNEGLTFVGGVSFAIPTRRTHTRKRVRTIRRVESRDRGSTEVVRKRVTTRVPGVKVEVVETQEAGEPPTEDPGPPRETSTASPAPPAPE